MSNDLKPLDRNEEDLLGHVLMWGSDAYPVRKIGSRWFIGQLYQRGGFSDAFATKRAAFARFELYLDLLRLRRNQQLATVSP